MVSKMFGADEKACTLICSYLVKGVSGYTWSRSEYDKHNGSWCRARVSKAITGQIQPEEGNC